MHGAAVKSGIKKPANLLYFVKNKAKKRVVGATGRIRTGDLLITNQLLYQLSHISITDNNIISKFINIASNF